MRKSLCLALLCIVLAYTNIFPAFAMEVSAQGSTYTATDSEAVGETVTDIDVQADTEMQSVSETADELLKGRELTNDNVVNDGYVNVEFILKNSAKEVQFNDQTLNWCLDKRVTYYYADGTTDTVFHSEKDVVKQVLTGRRYIVNGDAGNAIPGTGTLSVGLKISAAVNLSI